MDYNNNDFVNVYKRIAWNEFKQLKTIVERMAFDQAYNMLCGYNLENKQVNKQFDVNFCCITATIYDYNGHCVLSPIIDIIDKEMPLLILDCYDVLADHESVID